ncbi:RGS-GAIP interacting protein GIPC [Aphelenchoides avenae]|nr:RGS-GAIP interacting protein GIPC [Aphelenchus avenae]
MRSSRQHYRAGRSRSRRRNRSRRLQRERQTLNALVPVSQPTPAAAIADSLEDEHTVVETGTVAKRVFECQLAHGSSTVKVAGFNNNAELYQKIAEHFNDVSEADILFCTVNTHSADMTSMLSANLGLDDFIFAHVKGQRKEVQLTKTEPLLGLTIVENGAGKSIIKKIDPSSVSARADPALQLGDFVEQINGVPMEGKRHFQVTRMLRQIPVGATITLRLVSPHRSGFSFISKRETSRLASPKALGSGTDTIRFRANGQAVVQEAPNRVVIDKLNAVFDQYLGLHDDDLAQTVMEIGRSCDNLLDMGERIRASEIGIFQLPDELVFDMYGVISDWKADRLKPAETSNALAQRAHVPHF